MRKLSLKNLGLDAKDLLKKDQLKSIVGGYGGTRCIECSSNSDCSSGVCATYSAGSGSCGDWPCGCGKYCL